MATSVEIVQRAFGAFEQRDVEGLLAVCSAEIVFEPVTARLAAAGEPYVGLDGMRKYMQDIERVWEELRPAPDTYLEGDDGLVVATGRIYAWGAGRVIDSPAGWIWRVRDGLIVHGRVFDSATGALVASGLRG